jgi:hypothetical protein
MTPTQAPDIAGLVAGLRDAAQWRDNRVKDIMLRAADTLEALSTPSRSMEAGEGQTPQEALTLIANLAAVVRVQNGNRHEDTNALLAHADRYLSSPTPAQGVTDEMLSHALLTVGDEGSALIDLIKQHRLGEPLTDGERNVVRLAIQEAIAHAPPASTRPHDTEAT